MFNIPDKQILITSFTLGTPSVQYKMFTINYVSSNGTNTTRTHFKSIDSKKTLDVYVYIFSSQHTAKAQWKY